MKKKFIAKESIILREYDIEIEPGDQVTVEDGKELAKRDITEMIVEFFTENPKPEDEEEVHKFAEENGINPHEFEEEAYKMIGTFLAGGKAKDAGFTEEDADPDELEMGMEVELEHLNASSPYAKLLAKKIALDHLSEDPAYYSHLKEMEDKYKGSKGKDSTSKEDDTDEDEKESEKSPKKENMFNSMNHRQKTSYKETQSSEPVVKVAYMNQELKKLK